MTAPLALSVCQMFCGEASGVWPKPTGHMSVGNFVAKLDPDRIVLNGVDVSNYAGQLLQANIDRLTYNVKALVGNRASSSSSGGYGLTINIASQFADQTPRFNLKTAENYTLKIMQQENGEVNILFFSK